jgi:hypothetical protein
VSERIELRVDIDWGSSSKDTQDNLFNSIYELFNAYGGDWITVRTEQNEEHVITFNGSSASLDRMVHSLRELTKE